MEEATRKKTDPAQLRALLDLRSLGYTRAEIARSLGISRATYYRRLTEIEERRVEAADTDADMAD